MNVGKKIKSVIITCLLVIAWHLTILVGGILLHYCGIMNDIYLYSWLLQSNAWGLLFGISMALAVFDRKRILIILSVAHLLGLFCGTVFGPNPAGEEFGFGHYGWAWWIAITLIGLIVGAIWEIILLKKRKIIEKTT